MQCRSHAAQLGRHYAEFQAAHAAVLVILGAPLEMIRKYASQLKLPFPVLSDPERQVYHLYGLHKTLYVVQRTASIIVDREGVIRYMRRVANPMTWLEEVGGLTRAIQEVDRASGSHQETSPAGS